MNYFNTFISVAPDTNTKIGTVPPKREGSKSIAALEHEIIAGKPYKFTQEDVQFSVYALRKAIPALTLKTQRAELWKEFFYKPMACLRASPLPKLYGWGFHFNTEGKVALVAIESAEYKDFLNRADITQIRAMRSKRE
jgi:hypothetical protein